MRIETIHIDDVIKQLCITSDNIIEDIFNTLYNNYGNYNKLDIRGIRPLNFWKIMRKDSEMPKWLLNYDYIIL